MAEAMETAEFFNEEDGDDDDDDVDDQHEIDLDEMDEVYMLEDESEESLLLTD